MPFMPKAHEVVVVFHASFTRARVELLMVDQAQSTEVLVGAGRILLEGF